jgi:hypothetical protein
MISIFHESEPLTHRHNHNHFRWQTILCGFPRAYFARYK